MNCNPNADTLATSELGRRLETVLRRANLTPRNLGGATRVHWVTIYAIIRGDSMKSTPLVHHTLSDALDKIESLIAAGALPFNEPMQRRQQTERLIQLLN